MELKDVILSTLAEMENLDSNKNISKSTDELKSKIKNESKVEDEQEAEFFQEQNSDSEIFFLTSMRERLLVLFEGFQAPNNTNIEAKVDMTLNFLEYVLVTLDSRIYRLEKGDKK